MRGFRHKQQIVTLMFLVLLISHCFLSSALADAGRKKELAQEVTNPISSVTMVPFQFDYLTDIGPEDEGESFTINIQPLVTFSLSEEWNLISRTVIPLVTQKDVLPDSGTDTGLGDTLQSFFLSPEKPTENGWLWGVGPVALLPTGTDSNLTTDKFGLGPTAVALKVEGPWTYGLLTNHIWSVAGDSDREHVNLSFAQPFIDYATDDGIVFEITSESEYNWRTDEWSIPIVASVNKLIELGGQAMYVGVGPRYWIESTDSDPEGWGVNLQVVLLFPDK